MSGTDWKKLFDAAEAARQRAHAPYSKFHVGAAILCDDGSTVSGCNVENASYGLTVCAERNAVGAMVLGARRPAAVAIVVDSREPTPPCGMCRQVLAEFGDSSLEVRSRTPAGKEARWTLGELLPHAFTQKFF
ncbi:MAG: cytidine deaminase [Myxococcales bacterium]|nr:cytidine deaminase [Myxococcales bacterium]